MSADIARQATIAGAPRDADPGYDSMPLPRPRASRGFVDGGPDRRQTGWLEVTLIAVAIFLLSSPFTYTLIGQDPRVPVLLNLSNMRQADNSQWLLYLVRFGVLGFAMTLMATRWRTAVLQLRSLAPVVPFMLWAAFSTFWSDDPSVTSHSVAALLSLVMAAYLIALRLPAQQLARAVLLAGLLMGACSFLYAVLLPTFGVHQRTDASQFVHAGAWRGVYMHKNFLGHLSAYFAAAAIWANTSTIPGRTLKYGFIAFFVMLAVLSTSASAIAMIVITSWLVWMTMIAGPKTRIKALFYTAPALLIGWLSVAAILRALGRDATFSGRTVVWQVAFDSFVRRPFTGYGYTSITYGEFSYQLMRRTDLFDPHNGYFDTALGTGAVGLILFVVMLWFTWMAARRLYFSGPTERQATLVLFSIFMAWLVSNMTEVSDRPFTAMGGIGLFAMIALLTCPVERRVGSRPRARAVLRPEATLRRR